MYNMPHYKEQDQNLVLAFMKQHPFIMLTGVDENLQPVATQVPVLFEERDGTLFLRGHIMKGNDHHKAFEKNRQVLALFTGPHTYVSASWYENKQQGSTWNYMTVHAKGELSFLPEEDLLNILKDLTAFFENDPASPSLYERLPEEYISRLKKAILGFEIKVTQIEHVFKLSQNRDQKSFENIIDHLVKGDGEAQAVAAEMNKRKSQFFPS
jgi:transcriptional regulator